MPGLRRGRQAPDRVVRAQHAATAALTTAHLAAEGYQDVHHIHGGAS
ncbi:MULTISPECIES: hypothetical protein [Actinosynnema]|nr:hypothetical protein [Actinosynnema pretiosum]MCP2097388.1 hypothetical protein [Actinosynnema pretiosum]